MNPPPLKIGDAQVICYAIIEGSIRPTLNCKHYQGLGDSRSLIALPAAIAICNYESDSGYYLFGCNEQWETITDTWHESIEDAIEQAKFEFEAIENELVYIQNP